MGTMLWKKVLDTKKSGTRFEDMAQKAMELGYPMFAFNGDVYPAEGADKNKPLFSLSEAGMGKKEEQE